MWSLAFPIFMWGMTAAAVPLVLHLLRNRRATAVPFSTLRFIREAQRASSSRVRMQDFLLWLLRTLLIAAITLAFAAPVIRTSRFAGLMGRARRDVAIVWDASYSMGYRAGRQTVWERSVQVVRDIIEGLEPGDKVCIFLADNDVTPLIENPDADHAAALGLVRAQEPGTQPSQLLPATLSALQALADSGNPERELHIVTDGQRLPWREFAPTPDKEAAPAAHAWKPQNVQRGLPVFVTLLGPPSPENTTPVDIRLEPPVIMAQSSATLEARIRRFGARSETSVALMVDDQEIARRARVLAADGDDRVTFTLPPLAAGIHTARIETPDDALPADNAFYFLLRIKDQLPVLCVGAEPDTFYLTRALTAGGSADSRFEVRRVGVDEVTSENLGEYACIFLCNAIPMAGDALLEVEAFAREGGLLVIFPGDAAALTDYESWRALPGVPDELMEVDPDSRRRTIQPVTPDDPMLATLRIRPGVLPIVSIKRHLHWNALPDRTETVLSAGNAAPFLIARDIGRGRVVMFSVSADRRWSTLPLSPFFLPFAHQLVHSSSGLGRAHHAVTVSREMSLDETGASITDERVTIVDPKGQPAPVRGVRSGNRLGLVIENVLLPGVYMRRGGGGEPVLAANLDRRESDMTAITPDELREAMGLRDVHVATDAGDLASLLEAHREGRSLVEPLFWLIVLLALVELGVANRRCRAQPTLSEKLAVDAAGKVRGGTMGRDHRAGMQGAEAQA